LGQRTTYAYDAAGNQITRLDAKGQCTTYVYDGAGRLTGQQYSDGGRVTFAYDGRGQRTRMEDGTGVTTFSYNAIGRAQVVNYPAGKTITYAYDAVGNRSTLNDPDGGVTTYSYDSRNLLAGLVNPFGERTTWVYDALGRVTTMTHGNGSLAQHDYDAAGRLTALRNLKSDASVISIFTYSYDAVGNRRGAAEANGDRVTWSYDPTYQLTREQRIGANSYDITYSYDPTGNRLLKIESGAATTYSYDAANQLNTSEDSCGVTTYTYDANGNTIGEVRPNAERVTYTWDIENRMTKVELPSAVVNTITLDGDGKRRSIEDSGGLRNLIWDMENILVETDSNDATAAAYTMAPEMHGELISQRRSGATSFHHFDALGSTNKLTDANAATLVEYLYRAFGQQTVLSGSSANRFTWVGRLGYYRQPDAADYWVRARILKPQMGRWLTRDPGPVSDGYMPNLPFARRLDYPLLPHPLHTYNQWATWVKHRLGNRSLLDASLPQHLYAYCANNPLRLVDPSGRIESLYPALLFCVFNTLRVRGSSLERTEGRQFHWNHCVIGCTITRSCLFSAGWIACWVLAWILEMWQEWSGRGSFDPADIGATRDGCACGFKIGMSCDCCCQEAGHSPYSD
jgi:YD repeat-containing protein